MKAYLVLLTMILSSTYTFASGPCETTLAWATFGDGAAIHCKDGCRIEELASSMFKKSNKPGAVSSEINLVSSEDSKQNYSVVVSYTTSKKVKKIISVYSVVTNNECFIQSMTRLNN